MFLQEKVDEINKQFHVLEAMGNIVVWGAGKHTCKLMEKTRLISCPIKDIVDISPQKQGRLYFGFGIKSPEEVNWEKVEAVVVSVPGRQGQIAEMLREQWNFKGKIVLLYERDDCTPFYLLYDEDVSEVRYLGDYDSWDHAKRECRGYEDEAIIHRVIHSVEKVLKGDAAWERDGYLFYKQKYVYRICAAVLRCAVQNKNTGVRILDVGGALGSTYFQNKNYWADVKNLEYIVAEQDAFAGYGHKHLEDGALRFIKSIEDYGDYGSFDMVLMSASLQYIPQWREIVSKIKLLKPRYIILDRLLVSDRRRICKETVPEFIYKSSYPVMIYSEKEMENFWGPDYKLMEEDISSVPENPWFADGKAESKYYVFQLIME